MNNLRITAENLRTGMVEVIRRPRSLKAAADYLRANRNVLADNWAGVTVETNGRPLSASEISLADRIALRGYLA